MIEIILKQLLPPGVTVEMVTTQAQQIAQQVVASAQLIADSHRLLNENNAMLRQLVEASQQQSFNNTSENNTNALAPAQSLAVPPSADELGHGRTDPGHAGTYDCADPCPGFAGRPSGVDHGGNAPA